MPTCACRTGLLRWTHEKCLAVPFLIMTNYGQVENAVEAMQLDAVNYLCKPIQPGEDSQDAGHQPDHPV